MAIAYMKRGAKAVIPVGSADDLYWTIPGESAGALERFPQHGLLDLKLPVVPNMLPVAAARVS